MNCKNTILEKLKDISNRYFHKYSEDFKSMRHFQDCIETVYCVVSSAYSKMIYDVMSCAYSIETLDNAMAEAESLQFCNIHSDTFNAAFKSFRIGNTIKRVKYSLLLDILHNEKVIRVNRSFNIGKFAKSYKIDRELMRECSVQWLNSNPKKNLDVRDAIYGYYPNKLLKSRLKQLEQLVSEIGEGVNGIQLMLPSGWNKDVSTFGTFGWQPCLSVDQMLSDVSKLKSQYDSGYRFGRKYDWFTACSSDFRRLLKKDGSMFHELVDCRSGMFWMTAVLGCRMGLIEYEEAYRMIKHCFKGSFYSDIAEQPKSKIVKTAFMKFLNMHQGQLDFAVRHDGTIGLIDCNIKRLYPSWYVFVQNRRHIYKGDVGAVNHADVTEIERDIMDKLIHKLAKSGLKNLMRVHDAVWTTDFAEGVEDMLFDIAVASLK